MCGTVAPKGQRDRVEGQRETVRTRADAVDGADDAAVVVVAVEVAEQDEGVPEVIRFRSEGSTSSEGQMRTSPGVPVGLARKRADVLAIVP